MQARRVSSATSGNVSLARAKRPGRYERLRRARPHTRPSRARPTWRGTVLAKAARGDLERDASTFAPPLNQSPFVPAEAGTQGQELGQSAGSPLPRGRTEL